MTDYVGQKRGILMDDNPILKSISEPVIDFGAPLTELIEDMKETMISSRGRGLAAVQIGVTQRVLIAYVNRQFHVFINPVVTRSLRECSVEEEGCLSIPKHKWRKVARPRKCDAHYVDASGKAYTTSLSGELARIFQHELDHLNGILITDHPVL